MAAKLEVDQNAAIAVYQAADSAGKLILEGLFGKEALKGPVTDRVTNMQEACAEAGLDYDVVFSEDRISKLEFDELTYVEIKVIAAALNEGWHPNFGDARQEKYQVSFQFNPEAEGRGLVFVGVVSGNAQYANVSPYHLFKSVELARYAVETFPNTFNNYYNV